MGIDDACEVALLRWKGAGDRGILLVRICGFVLSLREINWGRDG